MDLEDKNKWTKDHPFRVPEGYFDQMEEAILQKVNIEGRKRQKGTVIRNIKLLSSIAASIALLVSVYVFWYSDKGSALAAGDVHSAQVAYVLENIDDFDLALLSQMSSGIDDLSIELEEPVFETLEPEEMDDELLELFFEM